jgi:hypothetical protein
MTQATDRQNTDHGATHGGPRRGMIEVEAGVFMLYG